MLLEVLRETVIDSLKLLPFLFAAYLAIEFIEDRAEEKTVALVHRAGRWGPVLGAALGVIPQCGFSAATANLYAGGIITRGIAARGVSLHLGRDAADPPFEQRPRSRSF